MLEFVLVSYSRLKHKQSATETKLIIYNANKEPGFRVVRFGEEIELYCLLCWETRKHTDQAPCLLEKNAGLFSIPASVRDALNIKYGITQGSGSLANLAHGQFLF